MINKKGFTLIEILIVSGIFFLLTSFAALNFLNAKKQTEINASVDLLISDLKRQQVKAMTGDTEGRNDSDNYGLSFGTRSYSLFHGDIYLPADSSNTQVYLGDNIQFTDVSYPGSQIIFLRGSGEIKNYASASSEFSLIDTGTSQRIKLKLNRYGVITSVN